MLIDPANPGLDAMVGTIVERDDQTFAVVASTPRSGTTYIRAVLEALGVRCGHENVFMSSGGIGKPPDWLTVEVSGFAGLHPFTNDGPVLHQIRNPLKVIASLATLGIIRTHDPVKLAEWYLMMFANNEGASDLTYRIEDLDVPLLRKIFGLLAADTTEDQMVTVLDKLGHDMNTRPRDDLTYDDLGRYGAEVAGLMNDWNYPLT
jgi:hypothetical protein